MKKLAALLSIAFFLFSTSLSFAALTADDVLQDVDVFGINITLSPDETIDGDYIGVGETVTISGTIDGDAYIAGGQVYIEGDVNGDLLVAGGQVFINGAVAQNVRAVGGQVSVSGSVGRNLTLIGGNLDLTSAAEIGGNLVIAGGNVTIATPIPGDIKIAAGNVVISETVTGNATISAGNIMMTPNAVIVGDLTYLSETEPRIAPDATVSGAITAKSIPSVDTGLEDLSLETIQTEVQNTLDRIFNIVFLLSFLASLIIGYLIVHFFPNFSYNAITTIEDQPGRSFVVGLGTVLLAPVLILLLLITVVGVPLGLITGAWYLIILYLAKIFFSYWLGARFIHRLRRMASPGVTLFVGLGIYYVLSSIAVIGPITIIAALIWGAGSIIMTEYDTYKTARITKIV